MEEAIRTFDPAHRKIKLGAQLKAFYGIPKNTRICKVPIHDG